MHKLAYRKRKTPVRTLSQDKIVKNHKNLSEKVIQSPKEMYKLAGEELLKNTDPVLNRLVRNNNTNSSAFTM